MNIQPLATIDWERIFAPAIQAASRATSAWTQGRVTLSLDEVRELPLTEASTALADGESTQTVVTVGIDGEFGGRILVVIDDEGAAQLAALLLNRTVRPYDRWSELETSALLETANILGSAYLSALTAVAGVRLLPTPPTLMRDYLSSIVQQAVLSQAFEADEVLLTRTVLRRCDRRVDWNLLFVPSPELLTQLRTAAATHPYENRDELA